MVGPPPPRTPPPQLSSAYTPALRSRICGKGGGGAAAVPFEDPLWNFKRGGRGRAPSLKTLLIGISKGGRPPCTPPPCTPPPESASDIYGLTFPPSWFCRESPPGTVRSCYVARSVTLRINAQASIGRSLGAHTDQGPLIGARLGASPPWTLLFFFFKRNLPE